MDRLRRHPRVETAKRWAAPTLALLLFAAWWIALALFSHDALLW